MMLRNRKRALQAVKKLDAFPKTSEECLETTTSGGTLSLVSYGVMVWLIVWECAYFMETKFTFKFNADTDFQEKLQINVDITVAMPCNFVGADVLDMTGQNVMAYTDLTLEDTWFELDPDQLVHFQGTQRANHYLRDQFHSVHEILWRSGYIDLFGGMPERKRFPKNKKDSCKISGSVTLNKVQGNFHITAGKSIPLPQGHAHVSVFMDEQDYNFSHRIERFSFGDPAPGIIHPLEGDEQLAEKNMISYQYFITVVPTKVNTYRHYGSSFQYSVSEQQREISHQKGSHGSPGIFFKYDMSALKVEVMEEHEPMIQFITRLIGIIGGIFTCSGLIHRLAGVFVNLLFCRYFRSAPVDRSKPNTEAPVVTGSKGLLTHQSPASLRSQTVPLLQSPIVVPVVSTPDLRPPQSDLESKSANGPR